MEFGRESEVQQCTCTAPEPSREDTRDADPAVSSSEGAIFTLKMGSRVISAMGTPCSANHPNIYRLQITHIWYHQLLGWILGKLPRTFQDWLRDTRPEWVLPSVVVLKIQKPDWEAQFDQEKEAYTILRPVQGLYVPICYGEVSFCTGKDWQVDSRRRGLLLSYLEGLDLASNGCPDIEISQVKEMLRKCFRAIAELGVAHDDVKLENILFVGNRAMLVDWELFHKPSPDDIDLVVRPEVTFVAEGYIEHGKSVARQSIRL